MTCSNFSAVDLIKDYLESKGWDVVRINDSTLVIYFSSNASAIDSINFNLTYKYGKPWYAIQITQILYPRDILEFNIHIHYNFSNQSKFYHIRKINLFSPDSLSILNQIIQDEKRKYLISQNMNQSR